MIINIFLHEKINLFAIFDPKLSTMKSIRKFGLLISFAFVVMNVSCGGDDEICPIIPGPPVGVEVKYEAVITTGMISQISYRMGNGDTLNGQLDPDNMLSWDKILIALFSKMPETAFLQVKCLNTTTTNQTCTLNIYKGTELVKTQTTNVPPADDNPDTDDTITITATTIINE